MGMWLFLVFIMILPLFIFIWGIATKKGRPKKLQRSVGYRTPMAMKNQETWIFAQKYAGKLDVILGAILILSSIIGAIIVGRGGILESMSTDSIWTMLIIWWVGQLMVILLSIVLTESALRNEFDKNGERK